MVASNANVDSAPWLMLAAAGPRPSKPPPVPASVMGTPASLSPRNQPTPRRMPTAQNPSPVTDSARAHASTSVAASIGCWSKAGRGSGGRQPPAGVSDRRPPLVSVRTARRRQVEPDGRIDEHLAAMLAEERLQRDDRVADRA